MKPAILKGASPAPSSSNETTHVQHAEAAKLCFPRVGRWQAEMHRRVKFLWGEGEFTPLGPWKVGEAIANRLCFLLTTALLQSEHAHSFCQKVHGQCKGGILKDYLRAWSWLWLGGSKKPAEPSSQGWRFWNRPHISTFLKSEVVPMCGTQGMFWTSGSIISALGGNLCQP